MGLDPAGALVSTHRLGRDHTLSPEAGLPADRRRDTDAKTFGRLATRGSRLNSGQHTLAQVHRQGSRHDGAPVKVHPIESQPDRNRYTPESSRTETALGQPLGEPATSAELVDEAELLASRVYREWAAPQDFRHVMLTTLIRTGARLAFIGVTRTHAQPRYGGEDKELMALLAPHVRRAITIADLIDHKSFQHDMLAEALDALSTAVLLVEGAGRLIHANAAGEALLSQDDVLVFRRDVVEPWDASALREAWPLPSGRARTDGTRTLTLSRRGGGRVSVSVLPLDAGRRRVLAKGVSRTALFVQNAEAAPNAVEALGLTYKLTGAELRVLLGLTEGRTAADIAAHYGIALTTVRTHLRSLFAKTGLSRQKDLIGLLFTAPRLRSSPVP